MHRILDIRIEPLLLNDIAYLRSVAARQLSLPEGDIEDCKVIKRSIDARGRRPVYLLRLEVRLKGEAIIPKEPLFDYVQLPKVRDRILIIGAGPAGYFAALRCIELGMQPVVIDRGYDVRTRRKDLRMIQQEHRVNPDSNYCFGEGGAGTYSDGKLYTRANKRGNVRKILEILVAHGAQADILIDAHPHIGSNKLPLVIQSIRETILEHGGEVLFDHRLTDFILEGDHLRGVRCQNGQEIWGSACLLATGHSARDVYQICHNTGVHIEFKPYAIGVRMEHPQQLIDKIQYNNYREQLDLPAASYGLSCQMEGHGVYSFCMCPGGLIVPAATSPGEMVVNGMSLSRRDSPYANAATVVTIDANPYPMEGAFGGMRYQEMLEQAFFDRGDGGMAAPAQRLTDFVEGKMSVSLKSCSYIPGIYSAPLHEMLPDWIVKSLRRGIKVFEQRMRGYYTEEAQLIGLESRTSAPIRIPRDPQTLMSTEIRGLFPCGEGAGYAGGILSAALDGDRVVDKICEFVSQ